MSVLSLKRPASRFAPRDWSQQEIADFYRACNLLQQNGASIGMDRGLTDIGEPWLVFYDTGSNDVFIHIARIDGRCILVCEPLSLKFSASTVGELVERFEGSVRNLVNDRKERADNVVLHPAARMIVAVSAVFLLCKLDGQGGSAQAQEMAGTHAIEHDGGKRDVSLTARMQSTISRLFEAADSPAVIAVIAAAVLSTEIANSQFAQAQDGELPADAAIDTAMALELEQLQHAGASPEVNVEAGNAPQVDGGPIDTADVAASTVAAAMSIVEGIQALSGIEIGLPSSFAPIAAQDHGSAASAGGDTPPLELVEGDAIPAADNSNAVSTKDAGDVEDAPDSVAVVEQVLREDFSESSAARSLADELGGKGLGSGAWWTELDLDGKKAGIEPADASEVSGFDAESLNLRTLDQYHAEVGYFAQTQLDSAQLQAALEMVLKAFSEVEIEFAGGNVMIEQGEMDADAAAADIGIWTNVMADGSSISIVGTADIIDDMHAAF